MELSINTRQAFSEIDEFIGLLNDDQRNMIPKKLRELFSQEKDKEYKKGISQDISIKDQNLKEETLGLIALLNLQYWCKDEKEKERLKNIYEKNEREYQALLEEKYNTNNLFKQNKNSVQKKETEQCQSMVEYKESILKKIMNRIFRLFRNK